MVTAHRESEDIVQALTLGANDYVTKPLDFPVVLARVANAVGVETSGRAGPAIGAGFGRAEPELEQTNSRLETVNGRMSRDLKAAAKSR